MVEPPPAEPTFWVYQPSACGAPLDLYVYTVAAAGRSWAADALEAVDADEPIAKVQGLPSSQEALAAVQRVVTHQWPSRHTQFGGTVRHVVTTGSSTSSTPVDGPPPVSC